MPVLPKRRSARAAAPVPETARLPVTETRDSSPVPAIRVRILREAKRGFTNIFRTEYTGVNVSDLDRKFEDGAVVTAEALRECGLVGDKKPVKILGNGELTKKLTVEAAKFTASAKEKIENAGGTAKEV